MTTVPTSFHERSSPASRLRVARATKRYGDALALDEAHLSVGPGEVHALVGENGAGKSTLIRLLAGVERADALEVSIDGVDVTLDDPAAAHRAGLRFVHQELNVVPSLSVAETLVLGRPYPRTPVGTIDWRRLHRRAAGQLANLGIDHVDPRRPMGRLGTGDAMLVTLARAFTSGDDAGTPASLYVLDEPTAALSQREIDLLFRVIGDLVQGGSSVVYVSHRLDEIFDLCHRITVFRDGRTVSTHDTADTTRATLIAAMTGRDAGHALARNDRSAAPQTRPALRARGLRNDRLRGIDLTLAAGTITVLTGLAGAGRSELLRALLGADRLASGTVHVGDRLLCDAPRTRHDPHGAWRAGVAFVPEERRSEAVWPGGVVTDHLLLPHVDRLARWGWMPRRREVAEARAWADRVGVRSRGVHQRVDELSGGNQQKVILARALAGSPDVLLLDEPTRGVDVGAKDEIYARIAAAAAAGAAVLVASSDLEEVFTLADRVVVMAHGHVVLDAPVGDVDRAAVVTASFTDASTAGASNGHASTEGASTGGAGVAA